MIKRCSTKSNCFRDRPDLHWRLVDDGVTALRFLELLGVFMVNWVVCLLEFVCKGSQSCCQLGSRFGGEIENLGRDHVCVGNDIFMHHLFFQRLFVGQQ